MKPIKEIAAEFSVEGAIAQQIVSNDEQLMGGRDDRLFDPVLGRPSIKMRGKIAVLFACYGPSRLA